MSQTNVFLLPDLIPAISTIEDSCCVVIDVLRATTTIITALGNRATAIKPVVTIDEARQMAANSNCLLGGERDCRKLEGFDFGNSPAEYTKDRVDSQTIALTTTNGTRALMTCLEAQQVLVAAFINFTAVADAISSHTKVNIICSGTNGEITLEDTLLAGALAARRQESQQNDQALLAVDLWRSCEQTEDLSQSIFDKLLVSRGGKNLHQAGMVSDIKLCAQLDTYSILPKLCPHSKTVQL